MKSVRKLISALALAVAFAGLSHATSVVKPVPGPRLPDAQIERNIKAKFAKSKINAEHFTVSVQSGAGSRLPDRKPQEFYLVCRMRDRRAKFAFGTMRGHGQEADMDRGITFSRFRLLRMRLAVQANENAERRILR